MSESEVCPNCGSAKKDLREQKTCVMMYPPENWRWVGDGCGNTTDFIECSHYWHDGVAQPSLDLALPRPVFGTKDAEPSDFPVYEEVDPEQGENDDPDLS